MAIIRAQRPDKGFFEVYNATARDRRLSYKARGVLMRILSNSDGFRCTADDLAREGKEGRGAILAAFAELRNCGYMKTEKIRGDDGRLSTVTYVYDTPQTPSTSTGVGLPDSGSPDSGSADVGQPDPLKDCNKPNTTKREKGASGANSRKGEEVTPEGITCKAVNEADERALQQIRTYPADQIQKAVEQAKTLDDKGRAWPSKTLRILLSINQVQLGQSSPAEVMARVMATLDEDAPGYHPAQEIDLDQSDWRTEDAAA